MECSESLTLNLHISKVIYTSLVAYVFDNLTWGKRLWRIIILTKSRSYKKYFLYLLSIYYYSIMQTSSRSFLILYAWRFLRSLFLTGFQHSCWILEFWIFTNQIILKLNIVNKKVLDNETIALKISRHQFAYITRF